MPLDRTFDPSRRPGAWFSGLPLANLVLTIALVATLASAQPPAERVRVRLLDGDLVPGRLIGLEETSLTVFVAGHERRFPFAKIHWIDFGPYEGAEDLREKADEADPHVVVKRHGGTVRGRVVGLRRHAFLVVRTPVGALAEVPVDLVARIYLRRS